MLIQSSIQKAWIFPCGAGVNQMKLKRIEKLNVLCVYLHELYLPLNMKKKTIFKIGYTYNNEV